MHALQAVRAIRLPAFTTEEERLQVRSYIRAEMDKHHAPLVFFPEVGDVAWFVVMMMVLVLISVRGIARWLTWCSVVFSL